MISRSTNDLPPALPAPFNGRPEPRGPHETPELRRLVDSQVKALVAAAPAVAELSADERRTLEDRVSRIAVHAAALALDDWQISEQLGQRPLLKTRETLTPPPEAAATRSEAVARPLRRGSGFQQDATSRVGSVTRSTLRAIAFPTFVADLIKGTFSAILDATTTQMGAFMEMLEGVSKTVEQFEAENISDGQAHQWLAQQYPGHIRLDNTDGTMRAVPTDTEADVPQGIQGALNLSDSVEIIDDVTIEEVLVPAARRKLAQSRLQMLSSLVMMGLQRIVINHGRIRATMGFHIDATDSASREDASLVDASVAAKAQVGFGMWSASASTSVTYVRSTKSDSNAELNVNADLTGEVDLTFSTDYMPLNRMATTENIARIRGNTPVPAENAPAAATGVRSAETASSSPSATEMINQRLEHREETSAPELPGLDANRFQGEGEGDSARQGGNQAERQPAREPAAAPAQPQPAAERGGGEAGAGGAGAEAPAAQQSHDRGRAA